MEPSPDTLLETATPPPDVRPPHVPAPSQIREVATEAEFGVDISPTSIAKMLQAMHPFYSYYEYLACRRYPRRGSSASRVEQMIGDHRRFFWTAVVLDVVLVLVPLSLAFIAAVGVIGYKTLWR